MTEISSPPKPGPNERHFRIPDPRAIRLALWQEGIGFSASNDAARLLTGPTLEAAAPATGENR